MGNAGSNTRERGPKTGDTAPPSPIKEGQAFSFDKRHTDKVSHHGSHDEDGPLYTKERQDSQQQVKFLFKCK